MFARTHNAALSALDDKGDSRTEAIEDAVKGIKGFLMKPSTTTTRLPLK